MLKGNLFNGNKLFKGSKAAWLFFSVICLVVVSDQITKAIILSSIAEGDNLPLIPGFFNLTLTFNKGAAFGLLADLPDGSRQVILAITTVVALFVVVYFLVNDYKHDRFAQAALALIVGGAVGNIIDRCRLGVVVDFLDVYYSTYHWPAFNVADSCICVGVSILFFRKPTRRSPALKSSVTKREDL